MSDAVTVRTLPPCDFDPTHPPASYDFKTKQGPWANGCQECWERQRVSEKLGTGLGQRLELLSTHGGPCPGCSRIMTVRERDEQGLCNDCNGGPC